MRCIIKILRPGDQVLAVHESGTVVVRRASGEVDLVPFTLDEHGLPRLLLDRVITIGYGDDTIEMVREKPAPKRRGGARKRKPDAIVGTFG